MAAIFNFIGASFHVASAIPVGANQIRLTFSQPPLRINPAGPNDALNNINYVLSGPVGRSISMVTAVPNDSLSVNLFTNEPLLFGAWTISVSGVQTPSGGTLSAPTSLSFTVAQQESPLLPNAEAETGAGVIRKHLNAFFGGKNWDALIAAIGGADDYIWDFAQKALAQLFLSSASGAYLRKKAADSGIQEYPGLAMEDESFRELSIELSTGRLTYISIIRIIEAYYGREAVRAYIDSSPGPFNLAQGQTLIFKLENKSYTYTVNSGNFKTVNAATPTELAIALTKMFKENGSESFAVAIKDASGNEVTRVFTAAEGLRGAVSVIGGTAQPFVGFESERNVYNGNVTAGDVYNWIYTLNSNGKTVVTLTSGGVPKIDITGIQSGDYVVIGTDTPTNGWYNVTDISYSWSGGSFTQSFTLDKNIGFVGTLVQQSNSSYLFYRPIIRTISSRPRSVIVSQSTHDNTLTVKIPAIPDITRTPESAAYIVGSPDVQIVSIERKNGLVTVRTAQPHGIVDGRHTEIAGFAPVNGRAWTSQRTGAAAPFGTSYVHTFQRSGNMTPTGVPEMPFLARLSNGNVVVAGGTESNVLVKTESNLFSVTNGTDSGPTQANGAANQTIIRNALGNLNFGRYDGAASTLVGSLQDQVLATGGRLASGTLPVSTVEKLVGTTWSAVASMPTPRASHQQVTLNDGSVLVAGGLVSVYQATSFAERYYPLINSWLTTGSMTTARSDFAAHKLADGRVLAIGGYAPGQELAYDPRILAYFTFDYANGSDTSDIYSGYYMNTTNTNLITGKVGRMLELDGSGVPNAPEMPFELGFFGLFTFATTSRGYTIDGWFQIDVGDDGTLFSYEGDGSNGDMSDNAIFRIRVEGGQLFLEYDYGNLTTEQTIKSINGNSLFNNLYHVALVVETFPGSENLYKVYLNGQLVIEYYGIAPVYDGYMSSNGRLRVGASGYSGYVPMVGGIDDFKIWNQPLTTEEIRANFLYGAGFVAAGAGYLSDSISLTKPTLNSCEIYNPATGQWTPAGSMAFNRGSFASWQLSNGEIMVAGGFGYPQSPLWDKVNYTEPNALMNSLKSSEIYSPTTNTWRRGPDLPFPVGRASAVQWRGRTYLVNNTNEVVPTFNDNSDNYDYFAYPYNYWLDEANMTWNILPVENPFARTWGIGNIMGGAIGDRTITSIAGNDSAGASGEINGFHKVTVINPTAFTFTTEKKTYTASHGQLGLATPTYPVGRVSNVSTIQISVPESTKEVFVNSTDGGFTSGIKVITAWTPTTISYADAGINNIGSVSVAAPLAYTMTSNETTVDVDGNAFIVDPDQYTVRSISSTTTATINDNQPVSIVKLASAAEFPGSGYIVFNLGGAGESQPIEYISKISSTELLVRGFTATSNWPVGTTVHYVQLDRVTLSNLWLTGTVLGRLAAERDVRDSVAYDIDLDWIVIYPSDRGLGGEDTNHTDAHTVWGPDLS